GRMHPVEAGGPQELRFGPPEHLDQGAAHVEHASVRADQDHAVRSVLDDRTEPPGPGVRVRLRVHAAWGHAWRLLGRDPVAIHAFGYRFDGGRPDAPARPLALSRPDGGASPGRSTRAAGGRMEIADIVGA